MSPDPGSFSLGLPELVALGGTPLYLSNEDALLLTVFNAAAGVTVAVSGRTLAFGAKHPTPFKTTLTPTTNRAATTKVIGLGDGWLLNAQVIVSAGTPVDGQTWARLSLVRGLTSVADESFTLVSDTLTVGKAIAWPSGAVRGPLDGAGAIRSISGTTPGAGAEVSETVPAGARWQVLSFMSTLVTSATVASRVAAMTLDDGTNIFWRNEATVVQAATNTRIRCWTNGYGAIVNGNGTSDTVALMQNAMLLAGFRIRTNTVSIQAGDQYSAVQYLVREWLEP
jgi:hypothetical protein